MAESDDELFRILADPTRRRILDLLATQGTLTVAQLAAQFPDLVPSGISKHLMGLRAAGLVRATQDGRYRRYSLESATMREALVPWLHRYQAHWTRALGTLRDLVEESDPGEGAACADGCHPTEPGVAAPEAVEVDVTTSAAPERAWAYFTDPTLLGQWYGRAERFEAWPGGRVRLADVGGSAVEGEVLDVEVGRRLRWRAGADGSEIVETFAPQDGGTHLSVRQYGAYPGWPSAGIERRRRGWREAIADLLLILESGVQCSRHLTKPLELEVRLADEPVGVVVVAVQPGGPADAAEMAAGDVIVSCSGAPVYTRAELRGLLRAARVDGSAVLGVVRDGSLSELVVTVS